MSDTDRAVNFLRDMLEHARLAQRFLIGVGSTAFETDIEKQFAVVRALEIIGEAAKSIPPEIRQLELGIPWKLVTGMRDKLVHHYFGVDIEVVWNTVQSDIPTMIESLERLLQNIDPSPASPPVQP